MSPDPNLLYNHQGRVVRRLAPSVGRLVGREDIDAWKKARNRVAHGVAVTLPEDKPKLQELYLQFVREINLINRVVLQMMGYRGLYVDYGSAW